MTDYRTYELNSREKSRLFLLILALTLTVSELFYGTCFFAVLTPLVYILVSEKASDFLNQRRLLVFREQFKDCLYAMSSSFSLGRHMREAMEDAKASLAELYGEDSLMRNELCYMTHCMDDAGTGEITIWKDFAARCRLDDVSEFADVFEACRDSGGNLVSAMNKAALLITEKMTIEKEINTQIMQKKYEGRIIGIMPVIMLAFLRVVSPAYIEIMYVTFVGRIAMTFAIILIAVAYISEERITSIDV